MSNAELAEAIFMDLCESDEITSPEEYPDHVLVDLRGLTRLLDKHGATTDWPEWASKLLKVLEDFGNEYDADDEINLPDELAEWLHHYASDIKRSAEHARSKQAPAPEAK